MKKQILTIAAVAALVAGGLNSAIADDHGKLTIHGSISSGTCTVPTNDLTKTINFPALNSVDVAHAGSWTNVVNSQELDYHVTGCADDFTKAGILYTYTTAAGSTDNIANSLTGGTTTLVATLTTKPVQLGSKPASGDTIKTGTTTPLITLASGAGMAKVYISLRRFDSAAVVSGDFSADVQVAMHYE